VFSITATQQIPDQRGRAWGVLLLDRSPMAKIRENGQQGRARSKMALLLVDVINAFDFEGCEGLVRAAEQAAPRILALRDRARAAGVPVIYVNDNFGQWRSDFRRTVEACSRPEQPGHRVTQLLTPGDSDYFVLKPRHSAFYCTALEVLLDRLDARTLIIVGFATNICVLFTANDAHMRGYQVVVPRDCTASNDEGLTRQALEQMVLVAGANTDDSERVVLGPAQ
jgi:nicotinamidase-related amidase